MALRAPKVTTRRFAASMSTMSPGRRTTPTDGGRAALKPTAAREGHEPAIPDQLVAEAGIGSVAPARIRHYEHARPSDLLRLRSRAAARPAAEEATVHGHADERDDVGLDPLDLVGEDAPPRFVLAGVQLVGGSC